MVSNARFQYQPVWEKYFPVVCILLKRSANEEQVLTLNRTDFEKISGVRKTGYKFTLHYIKGKLQSILASNDVEQSFMATVQENATLKELLAKGDYTFSFTTKFQLIITNNGLKEDEVEEVVEEREAVI